MHLRAATVTTLSIAGLIGLTALGSPASAQGGDKPAIALASTLAGVYTDVQATRGEAVFQKSCIECHVPSDYQGDAFKSKYVGGSAFDMFEAIRSAMPQSDPGSLPRQQYADLLAFFFKINGLPAGKDEVSTDADALKAIKVESKDTLAVRSTMTPRHGIHHGSSHFR